MSESILDGFKNLISGSSVSQYQRLLCNQDAEVEKERRRAMRKDFAKSKSGLHQWGPTHSEDSDDKYDSSVGPQTPVAASPPGKETNEVKEKETEKQKPANVQTSAAGIFSGILNCASETINDYLGDRDTVCSPCKPFHTQKSQTKKKKKNGNKSQTSTAEASTRPRGGHAISSAVRSASAASSVSSGIEQNFDKQSRNECDDGDARAAAKAMAVDSEDLWKPPPPPTTPSPSTKISKGVVNSERRDRKRGALPFRAITFTADLTFSRSISELTMRSSLGESSEKISESRRMAYYAVGNHGNRNNGVGGNRRCYFTGNLIRGSQPFYAGSVQQGLRTLVVFCLPSALGLPKRKDVDRVASIEAIETRSTKSTVSHKSRHSSVWSDGAAVESQHTDWEEDENGNVCETLDAEWLLQILPEPDQALMDEMEIRYPEQFATLPQQVRKHSCWRLYLKFCFFSGLPIADGEMYYMVCDKISAKLRKQLHKAGIDEIILSHEVMEAAHGQSAEIINLPTKKTFLYLQKHYPQQCAKLSDRIFKRTSWEKVMPEV